MQIGHGSFAQLGCGGQLEECGGVGALSRNGEQSGPAGDPGRDGGRSQVGWNGVRAMAGEEAQELHCFGAFIAILLYYCVDDDCTTLLLY